MDGWMTCDFMSFFKVFQSYQDDVRVIMKEGDNERMCAMEPHLWFLL